jgi:hypothetical protein
MAVPNPELPRKNPSLAAGTAGSNRPVPLAAGGAGPRGAPEASYSNRPIPLAPKSDTNLPQADDDDDETDDQSDDLREVIKNAPAWLVSTVFHMLLLIVLGLLAVGSGGSPAELEVEVGYTEDPGKQLEEPTQLANEDKLEELTTEPIVTPKELPPVDDPLVAPPTLNDLDITPTPSAEPVVTSSTPAPGIALALSGRRAGSKQALLGKYGGTKGTEAAVELGLKWLANQQRDDGSWSLSGPYADGSRSENTAAATAMALLAFQGHGDTHREGTYASVVSRGWTALRKMQRKDGSFSGGQMTERIQQLYTHGQCTIAICEIYGMTNDASFRAPAERAVAYAVEVQDKSKGGWRYIPGQDSDTSVTGWFMMALQSARMAKLAVPQETLQGISRYLDSAAIDGGRRYGYWHNASTTPAMCAEGLLCRQYLGWPRDDVRLVEGATDLLKIPVSYADNVDVYYWYYATQVAHHMEGKIWQEWNEVMRREVPEHQVKIGPQAGSWEPGIDVWGSAAGRLYVTCLSIYNLEVYYRHLPIYAGYSAINALPPVTSEPDGSAPETPEDKATAEEGTQKPAAKTDSPPTDAKRKDGSEPRANDKR